MRRSLLWGLGSILALLVLAALALRSPAIQDRLIQQVARQALAQPQPLFGDDALRVLLCGSSGPLPHPTRAKPCVAVFAGDQFYVVDTGPGSWNRLASWRIDGARIGGVLLTHFHSDHIGELGEFDLQTWVMGRPGPLQVYGPPGVERVVAGFEEAYALDAGYRIAHHGAELLPPQAGEMEARPIALPRGRGSARVLKHGDLEITAFAVDHAPVDPAYGYRFDYRGRSVVISGDTSKTPAMVEFARDADLLVHEAQANHIVTVVREAAREAGRSRVEKILGDIPDYHASPAEAAELANEADVGLLVFYHLTPPPPIALAERIYVREVAAVRSNGWILGQDGLLVELPVGSEAIETSELD